jgi:hypothetical protein
MNTALGYTTCSPFGLDASSILLLATIGLLGLAFVTVEIRAILSNNVDFGPSSPRR